MDRDTLFYAALTPKVVAKWFEGKDTETITSELSRECGEDADISISQGDVANALARWRDAQAQARAA